LTTCAAWKAAAARIGCL